MTRFWDGRTDGRTDGQTDGRTDGRSDCTPRPAFAFGDAGKNKALEETTRLHKIKGSFSFYTCSVFVYMRNFHSYITTAGEELQVLIYDGHSWPLSSEGSSICHTCCDTWHPFTMVISEDVSELVGRRF